MAKRNIDGEKQRYPDAKPGREEFAPDFPTYAERREAMKDLYKKSQQQKKK